MSTKFLHIPRMALEGRYDESGFNDKDFESLRPYLPQFLTNMSDNYSFNRFIERYPSALDILKKKNGYEICMYVASRKDGPFMQYLLQHPPEGKTVHEFMQEAEYLPVHQAIQEHQHGLIAQLMEGVTDEDYEKYFINKRSVFAYVLGEKDFAKSIVYFLRNIPIEVATKIIQQDNGDILTHFLYCDALNEFEEVYQYLPDGDKLKFLSENETLCIFAAHSSDGLHKLVEVAGTDNIRKGLIKSYAGDRRDPLGVPPEGADKQEVTRAYALLDKLIAGINIQPLLNAFTANERDQIASSNYFGLASRALQWNNPAGFRSIFDALNTKNQKALFKEDHIVMWFRTREQSGDYKIFDELEDILPEHIKKMAKDRRPPMHYNYDSSTTEKDEFPETVTNIYDAKKHQQFNKKLYDQILPLIAMANRAESTAGIGGISNEMEFTAAKLAILFENFSQVDSFLASMAKGYGAGPLKQPVHDAGLMEIPFKEFNTKHWARVVQHYGPAATKFMGAARKIEEYAKNHGLPLPQKPREIAAIAKYCFYKRAHERLAFAQTCMELGVTESQFNRCLDVLEGKATVKIRTEVVDAEHDVVLKITTNIPSITIDGEKIGHPGYYMRKLNLTEQVEQQMLARMKGLDATLTDREIATILGELSHCCQSVGKAGEKFTLHGMTSEDGDFYVWMKKLNDRPDQIVAQSWVWRADDEHNPNTIVFDSIEPLGAAHNGIFKDFILEFAKQAKDFGIDKVNIGKGGKTPVDLPFATAGHPARLSIIDFRHTGAEYDSKEQWEVRLTSKAPYSQVMVR